MELNLLDVIFGVVCLLVIALFAWEAWEEPKDGYYSDKKAQERWLQAMGKNRQ